MSSSNRRTLLHRGRLRREKIRKPRHRYLKAKTEKERRAIPERDSRIAPPPSPDQVQVRAIEGEMVTVIELRVHPSDLGKVIGRHGRTAESIRTSWVRRA